MSNSTSPAPSLSWANGLKKKAQSIARSWAMWTPLKLPRTPIPTPFCATIPFVAIHPTKRHAKREIRLGKEWVEQTFQRPCVGLRPGCGFLQRLRGDKWLVDTVADAGFSYVSSLLWGPETTVPALLTTPFTYADDGQPDLWELPGHGWHENLLKAHNLTVDVRRILAWPSPMPEAIRLGPISTPEEEFAMNKLFIDRAIALDLPFVSLIWHPWSLYRFDPEMKMLKLTFAYVRELGMQATTYEAEWQTGNKQLSANLPRSFKLRKVLPIGDSNGHNHRARNISLEWRPQSVPADGRAAPTQNRH